MSTLFNRNRQTERRQQLRRDMPKAEALLWSILKGRQILGCKFRRQYVVGPYVVGPYVVGPYVVDFFSSEVNLAIETDGDSHYQPGAKEKDDKRQSFIEAAGIRVIRFLNSDVYSNLEGVYEVIVREVQARQRTRAPGRRVRRGKKTEGTSKKRSTPPYPPYDKGGEFRGATRPPRRWPITKCDVPQSPYLILVITPDTYHR